MEGCLNLPEDSVELSLEREKGRATAERQAELESIRAKHDDFVREAFHLEKFVNLLGFDPVAARQDSSEVFRTWSAKYDLLEQISTTRSTRSARASNAHLLVPSPAVPSSPRRRAPNPKPSQAAPAIFNILATANKSKGKGKQREMLPVDIPKQEEDVGTISTAPTTKSRREGSTKVPREPPDPQSSGIKHVESQRQLRVSNPRDTTRKRTFGEAGPSAPRKRRKSEGSISAALITVPPSTSQRITRQSPTKNLMPVKKEIQRSGSGIIRIAARPKVQVLPPPPPPRPRPLIPPPPPPPTVFRRVTLKVGRRPITASHPSQRPGTPSHGYSLSTYLASYIATDDYEGPGTQEALDRVAQERATKADRIVALRLAGQLQNPPEIVDGAIVLYDSPASRNNPDNGPDVWDFVLDAITKRRIPRVSHERATAAAVAKRVKGYWEDVAAKELRRQYDAEIARRSVFVVVVEEINAQWKAAASYILEERNLLAQAEETKRGHEHLDAILDQSYSILESQQVALAGRSRSRSTSEMLDWPASDDNDGSDTSKDEDEMDVDKENSVDSGEGDDTLAALMAEPLREGRSEPLENPSSTVVGSPTSPVDLRDSSLKETSPSLDLLLEVTLEAPWPAVSLPVDAVPLELPLVAEKGPEMESCEPIVVDSAESSNDASGRALIPASPSVLPQRPIDPPIPSVDIDAPPGNAVEPDLASALPFEDGMLEDDPPAQAEMECRSEDEFGEVPEYMRAYAVAPIATKAATSGQVKPPLLLRGHLRPYQQSGLEWLASLHANKVNGELFDSIVWIWGLQGTIGILADEMGLGKTIQTISLLAHLACDKGIWGPHLIVVPTSVLLNWEMEFKKFLPGFKTLSYHGSTKRRRELRQGWNDKYTFNVCITSYTLASRDALVLKRKPWYYMILDEAHMIKNFKSQRWNTLLMFRSFRRLLLTGTPLQNNLTELWALLQFLMSGTNFANLKEFGEWFSGPLEKAVEMGTLLDDDTIQRVGKLHTMLRPYLLRRLKRDVEKELPKKYEHLVICPLSNRQRSLYDEFMSRAHTQQALQSRVYQKIANILMQLRKVCNHPDLFETRAIVTSFAMERSAVADFEIKELLIRRRMVRENGEDLNLDVLGLRFIDHQNKPLLTAVETRRLDATAAFGKHMHVLGAPPPRDTRTINGFRERRAYERHVATNARWTQNAYINRLRCGRLPVYGQEILRIVDRLYKPTQPSSTSDARFNFMNTTEFIEKVVRSPIARGNDMASIIDRFAFCTPAVVARDMPKLALAGLSEQPALNPAFDVLHRPTVKLQIAFPDPSLLQYDCGKLQQLAKILREKRLGGHRVLIFTQMTKILDILEIFLSFHGHLYLRLDGATKIEDRQYITERFNADSRVFCFIASSRSGGVGINLTGADTVVFYDSDFNPQMDRQCEDRAHRIGQMRDVHIYRFVSQHTVEEAMLRKANQKRSLDDLVIQKGQFDWRSLFGNENALASALGEFDDTDDAHAARVAAREQAAMEGADAADFNDPDTVIPEPVVVEEIKVDIAGGEENGKSAAEAGMAGDQPRSLTDYMLDFARLDEELLLAIRV